MAQHTPTIMEMRIFLQDLCPEENELIDALEYSDTDIMNAMLSCVGYANGAMGGSGCGGNWTVNSFPANGREFLKRGVAAYLLKSKAISLLRNTLPYNAGGVSIDDQNKSAQYMKLAGVFDEEWKIYVGRLHHEANFKRAFTSLN